MLTATRLSWNATTARKILIFSANSSVQTNPLASINIRLSARATECTLRSTTKRAILSRKAPFLRTAPQPITASLLWAETCSSVSCRGKATTTKTQSLSVKNSCATICTLPSTSKNTKSNAATPNSVTSKSQEIFPTFPTTFSRTLTKTVSSESVRKSKQAIFSSVKSPRRARRNSLPKKDCSARSSAKRQEKFAIRHLEFPTAKAVS